MLQTCLLKVKKIVYISTRSCTEIVSSASLICWSNQTKSLNVKLSTIQCGVYLLQNIYIYKCLHTDKCVTSEWSVIFKHFQFKGVLKVYGILFY